MFSSSAFDKVVHKWLRVPYHLNVRYLHKSKKRRGPNVLLIHGLGSTGNMWQPVIKKLPKNCTIIAVDLLGFGKSPSPHWQTYDAKLQARALLATYIKLHLSGPVVIAGHSLGALVAVEFAKRYPSITKSLVLCSPPIYQPNDPKLRIAREKVLHKFYTQLAQRPKLVMRMYSLGRVARIDSNLMVSQDNILMFASSMQASIINQTTINDITKLQMPVQIIHGTLDPLVIKANLVDLAKNVPNINFTTVNASHALKGPYVTKVAELLNQQLATQ